MYNTTEIRPILNWFFKELLGFRRARTMQVILYDVLSIVLQTSGYAAIMIYVHHLNSGKPIVLFGYELKLLDSVAVITCAGSSLCLLLAAAGISMYKGRSVTANLARLYEEYTLCRMFHIYAYPNPDKCFSIDFYENKKLFQVFVARAPNYLGRIYMEVMSSLVAIIAMITSLCIMTYIEPILTGILVGIVCISLPMYIYLNKLAYNSSEGLKEHAKGYALNKANTIDYILASPDLSPSADMKMAEMLLSESTAKFLDSYEVRLKITHTSLMATNFVGAVMIFGIFLFMGYKVNYHGYSWGKLLLYLIPLKYFLSGLRAAFKLYTKLYTFLPYFKPYLFIASHAVAKKAQIGGAYNADLQKIDVKVRGFLYGSEKRLILNRGTPVHIVSSRPISRVTMNSIVCKLNGLSSLESHKVQNFTILNREINMEDVFRVVSRKYKEIKYIAGNISSYQVLAVERLSERIDRNEKISQWKFLKIWSHFAPEIRLFISIESCRGSNITALFIDSNQLEIPAHEIKWLEVAPNVFIFIHSHIDSMNANSKITKTTDTLINVDEGIRFLDTDDMGIIANINSKTIRNKLHLEGLIEENTVEDDLFE